MRVPVPLVGPSYQSRELPLSAQISKNLYASIDPEARTIVSMHGFPGAKLWAATSAGPDRGLYAAHGALYHVRSGNLYKLSSTGTATTVGGVSGASRCDFSHDAEHLVIATGGDAYQYADGELSTILDPDLVSPTTTGNLNSLFIYDTQTVDGGFVVSDVGDPDSIQSADEATAESHPDDILRIIIYNQLIHFFGSKTIEPWFNSGVGNPPVDRVQGAVKPYGLAGAWAIDQVNEDLFFLDSKRIPRRMRGLEVTGIGNNALGKEWESYSSVSDAIGMAFELDHQIFFVLTFPSADKTWIYHEPSNSWDQWSFGVNNARARASSYAYAYGKHLIADHSNGNIYELDFDTYTDNGEVIQRQRTTASIHGGLYGHPGAELYFDRVEFVVQVGEGVLTGQGVDPQLMVRYSDDGGKTYSAQEFYPLGVQGDYLRRVELLNQGKAFQRIYELTYSEPTPFALFSAHADISIAA